jgi:hypothetical protein
VISLEEVTEVAVIIKSKNITHPTIDFLQRKNEFERRPKQAFGE